MDPFNSAPPAAGPATGPPCASCRQPMDPATASYNEAGDMICRRCSAASSVAHASAVAEAGDPTSARNLYGAAAASALMGTVTCCVSAVGLFYFVAAPIAVLISLGTLYNVLRRPELRQELGAGYWAVIAGAVVGLVFSGLGLIIIGLQATMASR